MESLTLSLAQFNIAWENPQQNLTRISNLLSELKGKTHIVVLPEMFTTGFSMNPKGLAETEEGSTLQWMKQEAGKNQLALCGSLMVKDGSRFYNRFYFVEPNGNFHTYNKRHLFRMMNEHQHYQMGTERVVFSYLGWRIMPQICYDLRFPVWSRNRNDYDLLIYVANFPAARQLAWDRLVPARAVENACYVAAVNRVGADGNGVVFSGHSQIVDYKGQNLTDANIEEEKVIASTISMASLREYREKFPTHLDADPFTLHI